MGSCDVTRASVVQTLFVTVYCVGVSADTNCVAEFYLGHSI